MSEAPIDPAGPEADDPLAGDGDVDLRVEGISARRPRRALFGRLATYAPVAYAGAVVLRDATSPLWVRVVGALGALELVRRMSPAVDELQPRAARPTRVAIASAVVGALLAAAFSQGRGPDDAHHLGGAASVFASGLAAAAALVAIDFIPGLGGIARDTARASRVRTYALVLAWLTLSGLEAVRVGLADRATISRLLATTGASWLLIGATSTLLFATLSHVVAAGRRRRFELGALERHQLLLGAAALTLPIALLTACAFDPVGSSPASTSVLLAGPALALAVGAIVAHVVRDPIKASSQVAHLWTALVLGSVAAVGVDVAAMHRPPALWIPIASGVLVGLSAARIARVLDILDRHRRARTAVGRAREASLATDRRDLERGVLGAMRAFARPVTLPATTPRLLTFDPPEEVTLDAAGEPRTRSPEWVPRPVLDLLVSEPLGVLRAAVLDAFEVRRPDLRVARAWCDRCEVAAVVGVVCDGELEGVLVLPRGDATIRLGLIEVRALHAIARGVATRIALETAGARSHLRVEEADRRAREAEDRLDRAAQRQSRLAAAIAAASDPLANDAALGGYAPTARALRSELEAVATAGNNPIILHPVGTSPLPYAARFHRAAGRTGGMVVVDAARDEGISLSRWNDPHVSPIELANDGTLVILSAQRLVADVQRILIRALAFRSGPAGDPAPLDVRIVLAVPLVGGPQRAHGNTGMPRAGDDEVWGADLAEGFLDRFRAPPIRIPPLAERTEDIRAIALDRLATLGAVRFNAAIGISDAALAVLLEHSWPGDDQELDLVLLLAALRAPGRRLERDDVRAAIARA